MAATDSSEEWLRSEVDRLQRELDQTSSEKIQSAQYCNGNPDVQIKACYKDTASWVLA